MNNITDELREFANKAETLNTTAAVTLRLSAIADRIDAKHEKAMSEQFKSLTVDMKPMTDENMAEGGWVRLPVDADGEYIHVGDWLEGHTSRAFADDAEYLALPLVAKSLTLDSDGWHVGILGLDPAELHHLKQTVEDVLREFGKCWDDPVHYAKGELVEAYAAKLQLRED